jgi:hypothetical protein
VADIAHEVIYRLKEGKSTEWLFSSNPAVFRESPITPERNKATSLVISPPVCVGVNGFLAINHPKKHQNGHMPTAEHQQPFISACYQEALD